VKRIFPNNLYGAFIASAIACITLFSACQKKNDGYLLASEKVTRVIQINVGAQVYSIKSVPDVISFSTTAINTALPNYRQYLVKGNSIDGNLGFTLSFHIDTLGSGRYVMEGSQLLVGTKTYISLASKTTDITRVTKIDDSGKTYSGNFTFYSFNKSSITDSVLVTGSYNIQY
jgi:hypothetical protein